jgi:hypothetical protein
VEEEEEELALLPKELAQVSNCPYVYSKIYIYWNNIIYLYL